MADLLNPVRPESPYDTQFPPEMVQDAASLRRRRALVDLLLTRSLTPPPTPSSGGITIPISPLASLSGLASGGVAALAQRGLDRGEQDLAARYSGGLSDARGQVSDLIKSGDYAGASQVAGRWPALKTVSDKLMERQFPQYAIHPTYGPGGTEQPAAVNMNAPGTPPIPIGGMKTPPLHPIETAGPTGEPQTSFVNLQDPTLAALPKPVKMAFENTGGEITPANPYTQTEPLKKTLDPNRVPTPEDIEANAKMIAEYRMPGYTGMSARSPGAALVMRRVSEINPQYDASIYPVAKAGEINFIEKNGPQIRSFGTLARHTEAAKDLFAALNNPSDIRRINQARNFFAEEFGAAPPTQVNLAKQFIADEMAKAVLNGPGALDDRKHFAEALSRSASSAQFAGDLDTTMKFAVEQMKGHEQQYKSVTKSNRADFQDRFLDPQMQAIYRKYGGGRRASDAIPGLPDPAAIDAELRRRQRG